MRIKQDRYCGKLGIYIFSLRDMTIRFLVIILISIMVVKSLTLPGLNLTEIVTELYSEIFNLKVPGRRNNLKKQGCCDRFWKGKLLRMMLMVSLWDTILGILISSYNKRLMRSGEFKQWMANANRFNFLELCKVWLVLNAINTSKN